MCDDSVREVCSIMISLSHNFVHTNTGASEMLMANAVQELAAHTPGKESMAAHAVFWLPTIIIVGSQKTLQQQYNLNLQEEDNLTTRDN